MDKGLGQFGLSPFLLPAVVFRGVFGVVAESKDSAVVIADTARRVYQSAE